jgi:hypothetical protein
MPRQIEVAELARGRGDDAGRDTGGSETAGQRCDASAA